MKYHSEYGYSRPRSLGHILSIPTPAMRAPKLLPSGQPGCVRRFSTKRWPVFLVALAVSFAAVVSVPFDLNPPLHPHQLSLPVFAAATPRRPKEDSAESSSAHSNSPSRGAGALKNRLNKLNIERFPANIQVSDRKDVIALAEAYEKDAAVVGDKIVDLARGLYVRSLLAQLKASAVGMSKTRLTVERGLERLSDINEARNKLAEPDVLEQLHVLIHLRAVLNDRAGFLVGQSEAFSHIDNLNALVKAEMRELTAEDIASLESEHRKAEEELEAERGKLAVIRPLLERAIEQQRDVLTDGLRQISSGFLEQGGAVASRLETVQDILKNLERISKRAQRARKECAALDRSRRASGLDTDIDKLSITREAQQIVNHVQRDMEVADELMVSALKALNRLEEGILAATALAEMEPLVSSADPVVRNNLSEVRVKAEQLLGDHRTQSKNLAEEARQFYRESHQAFTTCEAATDFFWSVLGDGLKTTTPGKSMGTALHTEVESVIRIAEAFVDMLKQHSELLEDAIRADDKHAHEGQDLRGSIVRLNRVTRTLKALDLVAMQADGLKIASDVLPVLENRFSEAKRKTRKRSMTGQENAVKERISTGLRLCAEGQEYARSIAPKLRALQELRDTYRKKKKAAIRVVEEELTNARKDVTRWGSVVNNYPALRAGVVQALAVYKETVRNLDTAALTKAIKAQQRAEATADKDCKAEQKATLDSYAAASISSTAALNAFAATKRWTAGEPMFRKSPRFLNEEVEAIEQVVNDMDTRGTPLHIRDRLMNLKHFAAAEASRVELTYNVIVQQKESLKKTTKALTKFEKGFYRATRDLVRLDLDVSRRFLGGILEASSDLSAKVDTLRKVEETTQKLAEESSGSMAAAEVLARQLQADDQHMSAMWEEVDTYRHKAEAALSHVSTLEVFMPASQKSKCADYRGKMESLAKEISISVQEIGRLARGRDPVATRQALLDAIRSTVLTRLQEIEEKQRSIRRDAEKIVARLSHEETSSSTRPWDSPDDIKRALPGYRQWHEKAAKSVGNAMAWLTARDTSLYDPATIQRHDEVLAGIKQTAKLLNEVGMRVTVSLSMPSRLDRKSEPVAPTQVKALGDDVAEAPQPKSTQSFLDNHERLIVELDREISEMSTLQVGALSQIRESRFLKEVARQLPDAEKAFYDVKKLIDLAKSREAVWTRQVARMVLEVTAAEDLECGQVPGRSYHANTSASKNNTLCQRARARLRELTAHLETEKRNHAILSEAVGDIERKLGYDGEGGIRRRLEHSARRQSILRERLDTVAEHAEHLRDELQKLRASLSSDIAWRADQPDEMILERGKEVDAQVEEMILKAKQAVPRLRKETSRIKDEVKELSAKMDEVRWPRFMRSDAAATRSDMDAIAERGEETIIVVGEIESLVEAIDSLDARRRDYNNVYETLSRQNALQAEAEALIESEIDFQRVSRELSLTGSAFGRGVLPAQEEPGNRASESPDDASDSQRKWLQEATEALQRFEGQQFHWIEQIRELTFRYQDLDNLLKGIDMTEAPVEVHEAEKKAARRQDSLARLLETARNETTAAQQARSALQEQVRRVTGELKMVREDSKAELTRMLLDHERLADKVEETTKQLLAAEKIAAELRPLLPPSPEASTTLDDQQQAAGTHLAQQEQVIAAKAAELNSVWTARGDLRERVATLEEELRKSLAEAQRVVQHARRMRSPEALIDKLNSRIDHNTQKIQEAGQLAGQIASVAQTAVEYGQKLRDSARKNSSSQAMTVLASARQTQLLLQKRLSDLVVSGEENLVTAHDAVKRLEALIQEKQSPDLVERHAIPLLESANHFLDDFSRVHQELKKEVDSVRASLETVDQQLETLKETLPHVSPEVHDTLGQVAQQHRLLRGELAGAAEVLAAFPEAGERLRYALTELAQVVGRHESNNARNLLKALHVEQRNTEAALVSETSKLRNLYQRVEELVYVARELESPEVTQVERVKGFAKLVKLLSQTRPKVQEAGQIEEKLVSVENQLHETQAQLDRGESMWRSLEDLASAAETLRQMVEHCRATVDEMKGELKQMQETMTELSTFAHNMSQRIVEGTQAFLKEILDGASGVTGQATAARDAAAVLAASCASAFVAEQQKHGEGDVPSAELIAHGESVYQAALSELEGLKQRQKEWTAESMAVESAWKQLSESETVLSEVQKSDPGVAAPVLDAFTALEDIKSQIDSMALSKQQAAKGLENLEAAVDRLKDRVDAFAGAVGKTLLQFVRRLQSVHERADEMATGATALKKQTRKLMRLLLSDWQTGLSRHEITARREEMREQVARADSWRSQVKQWELDAAGLRAENSALQAAVVELKEHHMSPGLHVTLEQALQIVGKNTKEIARCFNKLENLLEDLAALESAAKRSFEPEAPIPPELEGLIVQARQQQSKMSSLVAALGARKKELVRLAEKFVRITPAPDLKSEEDLWVARDALRGVETKALASLEQLHLLLNAAKVLRAYETNTMEGFQTYRSAGDSSIGKLATSVSRELEEKARDFDIVVQSAADAALDAEQWLRGDVLTAAGEKLVRLIFDVGEQLKTTLDTAETAVEKYRTGAEALHRRLLEARKAAEKLHSPSAGILEIGDATCWCKDSDCPLNDVARLEETATRLSEDAESAVRNLVNFLAARKPTSELQDFQAPRYLKPYVDRAFEAAARGEARARQLQRDKRFLDEDTEIMRGLSNDTLDSVRELFERFSSERVAVLNGVEEQLTVKGEAVANGAANMKKLASDIEAVVANKSVPNDATIITAEEGLLQARSLLREAKDEAEEMVQLSRLESVFSPWQPCSPESFLRDTSDNWGEKITAAQAKTAAVLDHTTLLVGEMRHALQLIEDLRNRAVLVGEAIDTAAGGEAHLVEFEKEVSRLTGKLERARTLLRTNEGIIKALPKSVSLLPGHASAVPLMTVDELAKQLGEATEIVAQVRRALPTLGRLAALAKERIVKLGVLLSKVGSTDQATTEALRDTERQEGRLERAADAAESIATNGLEELEAMLGSATSTFTNFIQEALVTTAATGAILRHGADELLSRIGLNTRRIASLLMEIRAVSAALTAAADPDTLQAAQSRMEALYLEAVELLNAQQAAAHQIHQDRISIGNAIQCIRNSEKKLNMELIDPDTSAALSRLEDDSMEHAAFDEVTRARELIQDMRIGVATGPPAALNPDEQPGRFSEAHQPGPSPSESVLRPGPSSEVLAPPSSAEVVGPPSSTEVVGPLAPSAEIIEPLSSAEVVSPASGSPPRSVTRQTHSRSGRPASRSKGSTPSWSRRPTSSRPKGSTAPRSKGWTVIPRPKGTSALRSKGWAVLPRSKGWTAPRARGWGKPRKPEQPAPEPGPRSATMSAPVPVPSTREQPEPAHGSTQTVTLGTTSTAARADESPVRSEHDAEAREREAESAPMPEYKSPPVPEYVPGPTSEYESAPVSKFGPAPVPPGAAEYVPGAPPVYDHHPVTKPSGIGMRMPSAEGAMADMRRAAAQRREARESLSFLKQRLERLKAASLSLKNMALKQRQILSKLQAQNASTQQNEHDRNSAAEAPISKEPVSETSAAGSPASDAAAIGPITVTGDESSGSKTSVTEEPRSESTPRENLSMEPPATKEADGDAAATEPVTVTDDEGFGGKTSVTEAPRSESALRGNLSMEPPATKEADGDAAATEPVTVTDDGGFGGKASVTGEPRSEPAPREDLSMEPPATEESDGDAAATEPVPVTDDEWFGGKTSVTEEPRSESALRGNLSMEPLATEEAGEGVPTAGDLPDTAGAAAEERPASGADTAAQSSSDEARWQEPAAEGPVLGQFETAAPVSDPAVPAESVRRRLAADPDVDASPAGSGLSSSQPKSSSPVLKHDIIQAVEALRGVKNMTTDLRNTEEEAAGHLQKLKDLKAQLAPVAAGTSSATLQPVREEIEDLVDEGWKLYQEYEEQMKELLEQQMEVERQAEQLKQLGEAEGISFSTPSDSSTSGEYEAIPEGRPDLPVQAASPTNTNTERGPLAADQFFVAEDRAQHLVRVLEQINNDAKNTTKEIRDFARSWVEKSSSEKAAHARRLVAHLKRLLKRGRQDGSELLEAINSMEVSLLSVQDPASRQGLINSTTELRASWVYYDEEFEDRAREADEALLGTVQKATMLHGYNASLQVMRRHGTQLEAKTKEITETLERAKSAQSAWRVLGEKAAVVDGTRDGYTRFLGAFAPLRTRTQDIEDQATALTGASEALLHAVGQDVLDARNAAVECLQSEGISGECDKLESSTNKVAHGHVPALQALVADLRHQVDQMRLAQSKATGAALGRGHSLLRERTERANELAADSVKVLREMHVAAFNMRKAAHVPPRSEDVQATITQDSASDPHLEALKETATHGADLGRQLEKLVSAMHETVLPAADVEETLHDSGLAAGMRYHAEGVQAQTKMWEREAATLLAEMRDIVSPKQESFDSAQRSWVRNEVIASLAVVKALLHAIEIEEDSKEDHVAALLKATILLNRTNVLLRRMAETEDAGDSFHGASQLELQAQADTLGNRLSQLMHRYDMGRFDNFVLSTSSALRSVEELGLPASIERAIARLGQTQAEVARLMRERSRLRELPAEDRAPLQKSLEAELQMVSKETSETLRMLHDALQNATMQNDPKVQRLLFTLSQGATLTSQLARGAAHSTGLKDGEGPSMRPAGRSVSSTTSLLSDIEGLSVLLGELQYQADHEVRDRRDATEGKESPEAVKENKIALPQAEKSKKDLDSLKELVEEMQGRTADVRESLSSTVEAFERVQRCAQDLQELRRLTPRDDRGDHTSQYVEKLSRVMETADTDRQKLQMGLGIGLGVVLALILLVAVALALFKRRAQRRLEILTRSEKKYSEAVNHGRRTF
ncbi:transmembrane [Cystoisospora suis]|uniref:Transmembrane n=1 Tax=Cystoisospora suis TaxID=483139 RepID=A0A2C6JNH8_9APIC|nr:transmembrane [Cystoisospora suis]